MQLVRALRFMLRDLDLLTSHTFDLLIVGGGIHGLMAAWDASTRGLHVALIVAVSLIALVWLAFQRPRWPHMSTFANRASNAWRISLCAT